MEIATAADAADLLGRTCGGGTREILIVAFLDAGREPIALDRYPGSTGDADLPLRAILSRALALDAAGLILAHNHPSGDPSPSAADIAATRRLVTAASAVGLRVWDHLLFADGACVSLRERGLV